MAYVDDIKLNRGIMANERDFGLFNGDITQALLANYAGMEWELDGFPTTKAEFDAGFKVVKANGKEIPTWEKLIEEMKVLQEDYKKIEYKNRRIDEYPSIHEQLDTMYHSMDDWKASIKTIKDKYPKG
jgi:hypothetical protein